MTVCGKEIAIKSTKHFGQLLLLETKDWDKNGNYIPNIDKSVSSYDYLVLIRMKPSCEEILKQNSLFYSDFINREDLHRLVTGQVWSYNYVGYITKNHLIQIIRDMHILQILQPKSCNKLYTYTLQQINSRVMVIIVYN